MTDPVTHPLAMDGKDPRNLRGDLIGAERYYSPDFMQKEWDHMWTKVWLVAGREVQLQEPGDYIVFELRHESIMIVRQDDGSLKAFFNACAHRGMRLVWDEGCQDSFACPYHGWVFDKEGNVVDLPDPDDFSQGDPCGKLSLKEARVDTWGGLVWVCMDPNAPSLMKYLEPLPDVYKNFKFESLVRITWVRVELNCNWKMFCDNFNESYHTRTAHPQVPPVIDQDHFTSRYEMFPMGHNRIVQMGRPSLRDRVPEGQPHPFDGALREWGIDPDSYEDYEAKSIQGWKDLKDAKKRLWKEKGYLHYENLTDEELTESPFQFIFPNIAFGPSADGMSMFRWVPHASDPEKCYFDLWNMTYPVEGRDTYVHRTSKTPIKVEEVEFDFREYDNGRGVMDLSDQVVFQDWQLVPGMQAGWRSKGYPEPYLANQETRTRRFHEVLHDYLNGNPPGRE
jgi:phenylpropionate dioxygenase-like ring-hydroxylating dioxygenase large terminal subunit